MISSLIDYLDFYSKCAINRVKKISFEDKMLSDTNKYNNKIKFKNDGNGLVAECLGRNSPVMISRLGSVELSCLSYYLRYRCGNKRGYPRRIRDNMSNNAGFFPTTSACLDEFCMQFLGWSRQVDVMAVWFNDDEDLICNEYCPEAELVEISCLDPFEFDSPWTEKLAGKKVLVVHPFTQTIQTQYRDKRRLLFENANVLPEFELITLKAVQSIANSEVDYPTWFAALDSMCEQISKIDFQICIIGAGAYGLPLAAFVKSLGKQAVHLGGVTQMLFGIKGRRWEIEQGYTLFNEHWVRPSERETPQAHKKVEKGCYW